MGTALGLSPSERDEVRGESLLWALGRGLERLAALETGAARSALLARVVLANGRGIARRASSRRTRLDTDLCREGVTSVLDRIPGPAPPGPSSRNLPADLSALLRACAPILTPLQHRILCLRLLELRSHAEVARELEKTRNAVRLAYRRGVKRLRKTWAETQESPGGPCAVDPGRVVHTERPDPPPH